MNMEINTLICTTIEQSKRLIELGLNSETADMHYVKKTMDSMGNPINDEFDIPHYGNTNSKYGRYAVMNFSDYETLPAWSLHRLVAIMPDKIKMMSITMEWWDFHLQIYKTTISYIGLRGITAFNQNDNLYDNIIDCIEWLIKEKYFDKEFLI